MRLRFTTMSAELRGTSGRAGLVAAGALVAATILAVVELPPAPLLTPIATLVILWVVLSDRRFDTSDSAARHAAWAIAVLLGLLTAIISLWIWGHGSLFSKDGGESHAIYLAAYNTRDLLTLLIQDLAASPDPAAHPFLYIHSPNLPSHVLSWLMIEAALPLEQQVYLVAVIGVVALAYGYVALRRAFSPIFALSALAFLALAYNSFYYNATDLLRGLLYLWFWLLLYLIERPTPGGVRRRNLGIALLAATVMLSDWGFAVFFYAFIWLWVAYRQGAFPIKWYAAYVITPAVASLLIYEAVVVTAVGWDFFRLDLLVTYFGRMGTGGGLNYLDAFWQYQQHQVFLWLGAANARFTLADFFAVLALAPALTVGPLWPLVLIAVNAATVLAARRIGLKPLLWAVVGGFLLLLILGGAPLPAAMLIPIGASELLRRLGAAGDGRSIAHRVGAFVVVLWLAILATTSAFPNYSFAFMIAPARPPMPLLEMATIGWLVQLVSTGVLARALRRIVMCRGANRSVTAYGPILAAALLTAAYLAAPIAALSRYGSNAYGLPTAIAAGIAIFNPTVILIVLGGLIAFRTSIRRAEDNFVGRSRASLGDHVVPLLRAIVPLLVSGLAFYMAAYRSAFPTVLGRYSVRYAMALSGAITVAIVVAAVAARPRIVAALGAWLQQRMRANAARISYARLALSGGLIIQVAWLVISIAGNPPRPVPYAEALSSPRYHGVSFLVSTYEAIPWLYTKGWTYMSTSNPPSFTQPDIRYRHLADWQNEAKYGRPDYFLCDNTVFGAMLPGRYDALWFHDRSPPPLACAVAGRCTCRDVAKNLASQGDDVDIAEDDFAIVHLRWGNQPQGSGAETDQGHRRQP